MLGLANTALSGSTLEALYSITLDGTDDYIDLGTGINLGSNDFTISLWVKTAAFHSKFFISEYEDANNRWYFHTNSVDPPQLHFVQVIGGVAHTTYVDTSGNTDLDSLQNAWTHLAISADRNGNVIGYVNGVAGSTTSGQATSLTTAANARIGRYAVSTYSDFQIDEVSIWNAALTSGSIQAIYNQGSAIDVASGASIDSTYLRGYWRMGNGKDDDKINGVIHDQHDPGYGADVVTDGDFPSLDNWTIINATGANQVTLVDGTAKITYDHTVSADGLGVRQSGILVVGKTYKLTMDVVSISGGGVKYFSGSTEHENSIGTGAHESYFIATGVDFTVYRQTPSSSSVSTLDNIVIKSLRGIPGLTSGGPTFSSDTP